MVSQSSQCMSDTSFSSFIDLRPRKVPTWSIIKKLCMPPEDVVPDRTIASLTVMLYKHACIYILVALALQPRRGAQQRGGALVIDVRHRDSGAGGSWGLCLGLGLAAYNIIRYDMIRYDGRSFVHSITLAEN